MLVVASFTTRNLKNDVARKAKRMRRDVSNCIFFHQLRCIAVLFEFLCLDPACALLSHGGDPSSPRETHSRALVDRSPVANPSESFPAGCPGKRSIAALSRQRLARSFIRSCVQDSLEECFLESVGSFASARLSVGPSALSSGLALYDRNLGR